MSDLVDFLLARIAEDEVADGWHTVDCGVSLGYWATEVCVCGYPTRVLAECDAKRRIVEWCSERTPVFVGRIGGDRTDPANYVPGELAHQNDAPVLRLLALPYADHPDYRSEWKP